MFNGEYEKHTHTHVKCDINVKIKNFRTRFFLVSLFDIYLTSFINKVACKLEKVQANFALTSGTATQACITLKKMHLTSRLGATVWSEEL